jgi:flagellar biosynthetic protein FlhB
MSDERTEQPTQRHLDEMRRKGEIAQSAELTGAVVLMAAVYLLAGRVGGLAGNLAEVMRQSFANLNQTDITVETVQQGGSQITQMLAGGWLSFFMMLAGVGLLVGIVQTRGQITPSLLTPNFGRLNPVSGFKRLFASEGLMETGKGVLKMAILALIMYQAVKTLPLKLALASDAQLGGGVQVLGDTLANMTKQGASLLLLAGAVDFVFKWRKHSQRMKMTREEVREEAKSNEGSPAIKAKIRQLQRRMSRQRMMQELVHADVVVANPTHMAIALRYDKNSMMAPVVVAKGKALIAEQIKKKARELRIPIVENPPLAHALILVELGSPIPVALYQAVAEVLAFVYRVKRTGPSLGQR